MSQWHPHPDQLVEFAAGSCRAGVSIAVSVHLHYCIQCRQILSELESTSAVLFEQQAPAPVANTAFSSLMDRIQREPTTAAETAAPTKPRRFPRALASLVPDSLEQLDWRQPMKNLRVTRLLDDGDLIIGLHHMKAGGRVPNHQHRGEEISVVLEGGFSDQLGSYAEGDFIRRSGTDTHSPQADADGDCLILSVVEAPVKLTGPLGWIINPFLKA